MKIRIWIVLCVCGDLYACGGDGDGSGDVWLSDGLFQHDTGVDGSPGDGFGSDSETGDDGSQGVDVPYSPVLVDGDKDGIPDEWDLFADDVMKPGVAGEDLVYAHTKDELWTMSVKTYEMDFAAFFQWPSDGNAHRMTDLAIDRYGVIYGVSYESLYVVSPSSGECWRVGELPDRFNALTWVPQGVLDSKRDVLVAISGDGGWYRLDKVDASKFEATLLGSYGETYTSSGDAYSIAGVGTFASVNKVEEAVDYLVEVNPEDGSIVREVGQLTGLNSVYGIAGWTGRAMAFDESGKVAIVDTATGEVVKTVTDTPKAWWGAGVRTFIP